MDPRALAGGASGDRAPRRGLNNREIAATLGESPATVKNQVSTILRKLRVPTRMRLLVRLQQPCDS
ncbi:MAG: hypothetical protein B9S26_15160 [Opitutia bacterium Tous-C4FEB]|nr:MAG: hypothetical protein B9S35_13535 [Opitutae bacterium Tous-C5TDCM]PAW86835.1 MAG: hypothetical protein B9S26_15160 [Opitutae bacterium Tous-C4FEB]